MPNALGLVYENYLQEVKKDVRRGKMTSYWIYIMLQVEAIQRRVCPQ